MNFSLALSNPIFNSKLIRSVFCQSAFFVLLVALCFSPLAMGKDFYLDIDLNRGYNSNVFLADNEDLALIESSDSVAEDFQNQWFIGASYEFFETRQSDAKVMLDYFYESFDDNEISSTFISAALPYSHYIDDVRLRFTPSYLLYDIDGVDVLRYFGKKIDATKKFGRHKVGLNYKHTGKTPLDDSYESYNGDSQDFYLEYGGRWLSKQLTIKVGQLVNDYAETLFGNESSDAQYASLSFSSRGQRTKSTVYLRVKSVEYVTDPLDGFNRSDDNLRISFKQTFYPNRKIDLYFISEFTDNQSNDNEKTYEQWINSVGTQLHF